jgi:hypothetical protein
MEPQGVYLVAVIQRIDMKRPFCLQLAQVTDSGLGPIRSRQGTHSTVTTINAGPRGPLAHTLILARQLSLHGLEKWENGPLDYLQCAVVGNFLLRPDV